MASVSHEIQPGRSKFEALLESAPDAIVIVDRSGMMVLANSQAEKLFGYQRAELLQQTVELLLPERFRAVHQDHRRSFTEAPHARPMGSGLNLVARRKDGSEFPVEISLSPLHTEEGLLITSIIRDITARKQAEATIRHMNQILEERVQQRTEELEIANRELLRAEQLVALGQVAAGIAHELRNPLTSIKGLVQVNRKEAEANGVPAEDLQIIEQEIRRMERTLQTFLDFARPPKPERRQLDLIHVIERVVALVRGRAAKQKVQIRWQPPPEPLGVAADQDQLQQLVLNLVLNALDAMPRGGTLEILLRPADVGGWEIRVQDTGPGIDPQWMPRIFEPFASSKETGLGLGLAVSRRIAEDHGGSLAAYNRPEGGACLVVQLPAASHP
jgi:PAS domain S-box-containing protein